VPACELTAAAGPGGPVVWVVEAGRVECLVVVVEVVVGR